MPHPRHVSFVCFLCVACAAAQRAPASHATPDSKRTRLVGAETRDASGEGATVETRPPGANAPLFSGLGDHHHPITSHVRGAQRYFDQGLVWHFGFNHTEAVRAFRQAAELDPQCAMCFAGVALSLGPNYNAAMRPGSAEPAYEAVQRAVALKDSVSDRERAYIEALALRYPRPSLEGRAEADENYARAIGEVAEEFPEDVDAAALHAEALMVQHPWDMWTRDNRPKPWTQPILQVLERALAQRPEHPFANHLYIHVQEAGPNPEAAKPSADRLRDLVPAAGHLVHMPSHVYIRTGDYHAASEANERAIRADEAYLAAAQPQGAYPLAYYPHNYHFLWATTMLEGRRERSLEAAEAVAERADRNKMREPGFGTLQHYLSIPYYAQVAFGRYDAILALPAPAPELLYPTAVWQYARGMALAQKGRVDEAQAALQAVQQAARDEALEKVTIWDINSTRDLMRIAEALLRSEIASARGELQAAVDHAARAVALEDALNYDEPPPWGPATRRYYGAALLAAGRPEAAEQAYREDLAEFPENGWSLYGLLQSLRAQGESDAALDVEKRFRKAFRHADVVLTRSRM